MVEDNGEVFNRLQEIQSAITNERARDPELELCIAGDMNRHDILWGGATITNGVRQGEGSRILDSIEENDLHIATPRGMITQERNEQSSTVDLIMLSEKLYEDRTVCKAFENEYGSDRRAIHTAINTPTKQDATRLQGTISRRQIGSQFEIIFRGQQKANLLLITT